MLILLFSFILFSEVRQQQTLPLVFINTNKAATLQKLEIAAGKTTLFGQSGGQVKVLASWNQVPANYDNDAQRSRYKMIAETEDATALRVYEISYVKNRQTQVSTAYIKSTFIYKDNRGRQTTEDYFKAEK
jgi:hypothetical protein